MVAKILEHVLLSCDYRREERFEEAETHFKALLNLSDLEKRDRIRTLHYLANVLAIQNKMDEAKNVGRELLELCLSYPLLQDEEYPAKPITNLMSIANLCNSLGFERETQELYRRVVLSKASTMDVVARSLLKQGEYCRNNRDFDRALTLFDEASQIIHETTSAKELEARTQYAYGRYFSDLNQPEKVLGTYWPLIESSSDIVEYFPRMILDFLNIVSTAIDKTDPENKGNTIVVDGKIINLETLLQRVSWHLDNIAAKAQDNALLARTYLRAGILAGKLHDDAGSVTIALNYFQRALTHAPADSQVHERAQKRYANLAKRQAKSKI